MGTLRLDPRLSVVATRDLEPPVHLSPDLRGAGTHSLEHEWSQLGSDRFARAVTTLMPSKVVEWCWPRGTHQSTYERLLDRLGDCEERRDAAIAGLRGRLFLRHRSLKGDPRFDGY